MDGTVVAAVVVGGTGLAGSMWTGWYAFTAARRTAADTKEIETDKLTAASWAEQVKGWRQDVITLREQRAEDLATYERTNAALVNKIDGLAAAHRIERSETEQRINAMVLWGQQVVGIMRARGITFPPPPPGMEPWIDAHESDPLAP